MVIILEFLAEYHTQYYLLIFHYPERVSKEIDNTFNWKKTQPIVHLKKIFYCPQKRIHIVHIRHNLIQATHCHVNIYQNGYTIHVLPYFFSAYIYIHLLFMIKTILNAFSPLRTYMEVISYLLSLQQYTVFNISTLVTFPEGRWFLSLFSKYDRPVSKFNYVQKSKATGRLDKVFVDYVTHNSPGDKGLNLAEPGFGG